MPSLIILSLTLRFLPGLSLSTHSRTEPLFSQLTQESPVIHELHSVDSNQPSELVRTIRDLHHTLQPRRQARPSLISPAHSFDDQQRGLEVSNVFITMFRPRGDRICGFKSFFDDSAPLPATGLFPRIRCRSIVFMISGELPMDIDSRGALTDARIVPRIVPFNGLEDLACSLHNLLPPADCSLSTQIKLLDPFISFAIFIVPSSLAGKPARRSYHRLTLSMTGNANWRSLTCLLLCFDCVEIASVDSNRPLTILRRFLQPTYFFEYDAEALFL
jgi:hypothetical protein